MSLAVKLKQTVLAIGDVLVLYASLGIALLIRYENLDKNVINTHLGPFTLIFAIWIMAYYIAGLYDLRTLKNDVNFAKRFFSLLAINTGIAIVLFYFVQAFGITPRANLFVVVVIAGLAGYFWRTFYNNLMSTGAPANRLLMIGYNQTVEELVNHIGQNPQLGYAVTFWMKEGLQDKEFEHIAQIIIANKINLIVVPAHIKKAARASRLIYKNLVLGIEVMDLAVLYENVFQKVPLAELEEVWFLENLAKSHKIYEFFKRPSELLLAAVLGIILLPVLILIGLLVGATSRGPIIFKQKRVGQNEKEFMMYKFRTMKTDAEKEGPQWAQENDQRTTFLGKVLRKTHLDELPQIFNILRGDLSFVGPRPERPEFLGKLKKDVPYFELRLLVRPGITGWAQINYKYGASVEEMQEKLQYDIYYLKNRSFALDFFILLRTIKYFFTSSK